MGATLTGKRVDRVTVPSSFPLDLPVSRETFARLALYESLLRQWQPAVNLVARATLDDVWRRHFADSAQLLALAPPAAKTWIDLGSGAGFPGLVLAIMLAGRPGGHVALIESDSRKAAFLREVARQTHAPATILCKRVEIAATQFTVENIDVVTARALAPLPRLLDLAYPFMREGAIGLFLKGKDAEREVGEALESWSFARELVQSSTDAEGRIVVIQGLKKSREG